MIGVISTKEKEESLPCSGECIEIFPTLNHLHFDPFLP